MTENFHSTSNDHFDCEREMKSLLLSDLRKKVMGCVGKHEKIISSCCKSSITYGNSTQEYRCLLCSKLCDSNFQEISERSRLRKELSALFEGK